MFTGDSDAIDVVNVRAGDMRHFILRMDEVSALATGQDVLPYVYDLWG